MAYLFTIFFLQTKHTKRELQKFDTGGNEKEMFMKITGKEEALKEIEKAMNLIREAEKILFNIPGNIGLEVKDGTEEKDNTISGN